MLVHEAESSYQKGCERFEDGHIKEALAFFSGAIEIERRLGGAHPQGRYLSYYGLCLGLTDGSLHEAVNCCRLAAKQEGYDPDVCCNLGRTLLLAGRRREAFRALRWGLRMEPTNRRIQRELKRMGLRKKPVLRFLSRTSAINVFLGRMRSASA